MTLIVIHPKAIGTQCPALSRAGPGRREPCGHVSMRACGDVEEDPGPADPRNYQVIGLSNCGPSKTFFVAGRTGRQKDECHPPTIHIRNIKILPRFSSIDDVEGLVVLTDTVNVRDQIQLTSEIGRGNRYKVSKALDKSCLSRFIRLLCFLCRHRNQSKFTLRAECN